MNARRERVTYWGPAVVSAMLGALLIAVSLPRIGTESYLLDARDRLEDLETGKMAAEADSRAFVDRITTVANAQQSARIDGMAARAWIALAGRSDATEQDRVVSIGRAQAVQAAGLALAPADQYGWQRLSYTLAERNDWIASAKAWQLGLITGPFEPSIMKVKFEAGLALWRYMDLPQRDAFAGLTAAFAQTRPEQLAALTQDYGAEAIIRQTLASRPELDVFEKYLAWRRQR